MNSLEEKIVDYIYSNQQAIFYGTTVDSASVQAEYVISLIDGEYSGMDATSVCKECGGKGEYSPDSQGEVHHCLVCVGTGTIRRKLSNKEFIEWAKRITLWTNSDPFDNPWVLSSGERIVKEAE